MFPKPPNPIILPALSRCSVALSTPSRRPTSVAVHRVPRAAQAHDPALVVRLRQQAVELLEVLALVQRYRRPCGRGIGSGKVVRRLHLQNGHRARLALCPLRIRKPDAIHRVPARAAGSFTMNSSNPATTVPLMRTILPSNDFGFFTIAQTVVSTAWACSPQAHAKTKSAKTKKRFIGNLSTRCRHCTDN